MADEELKAEIVEIEEDLTVDELRIKNGLPRVFSTGSLGLDLAIGQRDPEDQALGIPERSTIEVFGANGTLGSRVGPGNTYQNLRPTTGGVRINQAEDRLRRTSINAAGEYSVVIIKRGSPIKERQTIHVKVEDVDVTYKLLNAEWQFPNWFFDLTEIGKGRPQSDVVTERSAPINFTMQTSVLDTLNKGSTYMGVGDKQE